MASTILSNAIEPKVFTAYANQLTTVKSALLSSGVLARSADENGGGIVGHGSGGIGPLRAA
jgi:hypothetical protein